MTAPTTSPISALRARDQHAVDQIDSQRLRRAARRSPSGWAACTGRCRSRRRRAATAPSMQHADRRPARAPRQPESRQRRARRASRVRESLIGLARLARPRPPAAVQRLAHRGRPCAKNAGVLAQPRRRVRSPLLPAIATISLIRPGPRRHHHHPVGEEHRLGDRVGDEHDGGAGLGADPHQLGLHPLAGHLVERAERLVHQQQPRAARRARGRSRRAAACRRRAGRGSASAKSVEARPASSSSADPRRRARRADAVQLERQLDVRRRPCATAAARPAGRRCRSPGRAAPGAASCRRPSSVPAVGLRRGRRSGAAACDLPQPLGPISETNSPARHRRGRSPLERHHVAAPAVAEDPADARRPRRRRLVPRRGLTSSLGRSCVRLLRRR